MHTSEAQFLLQQQPASQAGRTYDSVLVTHMHRRDLSEEARQLAQDFLTRRRGSTPTFTVPRLDVINAQVSLASAQNDLIGNARDVTNAEAALNRMLGRPLGLPIVATDTLGAPDPLPDVQAIEAAALRSRPEITGLEAQLRGAKANSTLTKELSFTPDIVASANKDFGDPAWNSNTTYMLGLSMPIPVLFWQHTKGDFAETHHRELELTATLKDTRAAVAQDVRVAFATADAALRQVIFIRDELLPSAREAYRVATTSYALGGLSALDVLSARTALLAAESQFADALAAANSARSDLERAAGGCRSPRSPRSTPVSSLASFRTRRVHCRRVHIPRRARRRVQSQARRRGCRGRREAFVVQGDG